MSNTIEDTFPGLSYRNFRKFKPPTSGGLNGSDFVKILHIFTCSTQKDIKKQRHYFVNKVPSGQGYGFSSAHVWMWELDAKESWVQKNWCFWTVVLEKTLESPLDCRRSNQSILKISPGCSLEGLMLKLKFLIVWPPDIMNWCLKLIFLIVWPPDIMNWLIWKDPDAGKEWGQEEKGTTEDEMVGWHHWLNWHGFGWTPGVGAGQGGLVCCSSWGCKESDTTELNTKGMHY